MIKMSQITLKCVECGFALTYNLLEESQIDASEFVLFGKIWLCNICYQKNHGIATFLKDEIKK